MLKVEFTAQADDDILRLDRPVARRIVEKIEWFCKNSDQVEPEPLTGRFKGKCKLKAGDWRIIYTLVDAPQTMTIYAIEHRSKVYRK